MLTLDGKPTTSAFDDEIAQRNPGDTITVTLASRKGERQVKLRLGSRIQPSYQLADLPSLTPQQLAHRKAFIHGDDEAAP